MTVSFVTGINRYQGVNGDSKPAAAPTGSTFYEVDTGDWFVWDGDSWEAYTFPLLDATSPELPSTAEKAALNASASPGAGNAFITATALTAALDNLLSALPTVDPAVAGDLWNDAGVLTVSAG